MENLENNESDYDTLGRAFHIRISETTPEVLDKIKYYYQENKQKIKHILIGEIEESKNKGLHFHMALTFYNQRTGRAIMKAIFGDFKKIGHYIGPKKDKITTDDGREIKITYTMFYNYINKNGTNYEEGTRNGLQEIKEEKINKQIEKSNENKEKKLLWFEAAENKTPREFKKWMIQNGYASNIYDTWVQNLIKDQCKDTMDGCLERFKQKNKPIRCIQLVGETGVGKTLVTNLLFPGHFAVNKGAEKPFDKFDAGNEKHDTIVINEINDMDDIQRMGGVALLENLADEVAVPIDTKWNIGENYIRPCTIILVGNFTLQELVEEDYRRKQHKTEAHRLYEPLVRRYKRHTVESLLKLYDKKLIHDGKYYDKGYQKERLRNPRLEDYIYKDKEKGIIIDTSQKEKIIRKIKKETDDEIIDRMQNEEIKKINFNLNIH